MRPDTPPTRAHPPARHPAHGRGVAATLLKAVAYSQVPRLTLAVLHPRLAARFGETPVTRLAGAHGRSRARRAGAAPRPGPPHLAALAAAVVTLPLGVLLGRVLERRAWEHSLADVPIDDGDAADAVGPGEAPVAPV